MLDVAVADRTGTILGVYVRPDAAADVPDVAASLARTAAFFSDDQAPLSSRTVRFISGIHFPPGVPNTPNGARYGIGQTNRGCRVDGFDPSFGLTPSRSITGVVGQGAGALPLLCEPSDTRGCGWRSDRGRGRIIPRVHRCHHRQAGSVRHRIPPRRTSTYR